MSTLLGRICLNQSVLSAALPPPPPKPFTFTSTKVNSVSQTIPGYDTIRNDRLTGQKGGVAFLVKNGLVVNKEYRNDDFNIITDNKALAIDFELSNNQNLTMATIYFPNGNPNCSRFQTINNLYDNVMFVGEKRMNLTL